MEREKSLTIVAGPFTEYKPGDVVEIISSSGKRWVWRVVEGMEALGTWLDKRGCSEASMWYRISKANSMFYAKKALFCDPKLPVKRRVDAFYSTCVPAALHGAGEWPTRRQCSRHCVSGSRVNFVACFACEGDRVSA